MSAPLTLRTSSAEVPTVAQTAALLAAAEATGDTDRARHLARRLACLESEAAA